MIAVYGSKILHYHLLSSKETLTANLSWMRFGFYMAPKSLKLWLKDINAAILFLVLPSSPLMAEALILDCDQSTKFKHSYSLFDKSVEKYANGKFQPWCNRNDQLLTIERHNASCKNSSSKTTTLDCTPHIRSNLSKAEQLALEFLPTDPFDLPMICKSLIPSSLRLDQPIEGSESSIRYFNTEAQVYGYIIYQHFEDLNANIVDLVVERFEVECEMR